MLKFLFSSFFLVLFLGCGGVDDPFLEITPDVAVETDNIKLSNEPYYYQQWYLNKDTSFYKQNAIDDDAHIHSGDLLSKYSGKGIKIAIIDDGLDITHEEFTNAIKGTYNLESRDTDVSHTNSYDAHGTAVTGIIGARVNSKGIVGLANESEIFFLKYKDEMTPSETIEVFNKAEEFGADIINCSWGTDDVSDAVREKIVDLAKNGRNGKGTIIVFASGNDDKNMGNDESSIPEVIAVGATDKDNLRAYYSNFGKNLDIVAPGGYYLGITTLDDVASNGYTDGDYILYDDSNYFSGTSASAPIVSGAIALLLEKNPNLTRDEVENILKNTAEKVGTLDYINGRNNYYGYGKIHLSNMLK